ncbi:GNAT family N-acetyltransferase [Staphylospora marina]|uniref:GNAT family N-acetyltransferase n=1 Tax=Staphylospora marina TaxID=2490858 RepID=UPI000F5BACE6|nr:GNAT family N-acetyltransferase [Staphylospora marina]
MNEHTVYHVAVVLAVDEDSGKAAGFINAVSDGVLSAYIPLLEVLPQYRNRGIGTQWVQLMPDELNRLYMVEVLCDETLQPFHEKSGMKPATGMRIRNDKRQSGLPGR